MMIVTWFRVPSTDPTNLIFIAFIQFSMAHLFQSIYQSFIINIYQDKNLNSEQNILFTFQLSHWIGNGQQYESIIENALFTISNQIVTKYSVQNYFVCYLVEWAQYGYVITILQLMTLIIMLMMMMVVVMIVVN